MSEPERDLSGTVLDRYRLIRKLGAGGMGEVYEAEHELLDRRVAVKVLSASMSIKEVARKRFLREARAASRVVHPNVIEIHDVGFAGEHVFFVMELLPGRDLGQRLEAETSLRWPQARDILLQVTAALGAAHEAGVIHRDVKPSNCFLVAGSPDRTGPRVKVLDFGIAKVATSVVDPATELTTPGEVFGTVGYMPPEISQGITDDPRSDIYATGVMMFRMLTGQLPFSGAAFQVLAQHIGRDPPAPRSLMPSIPIEVERIILRTLEKDPADRYATMAALEAALRSVKAGDEHEEVERGREGRGPPALGAMTEAKVIDLDELPPPPRPWPTRATMRPPSRGSITRYGDEREPPPSPAPALDQTEAALELDVPPGWKPGDPVGPAAPAPAPRRRALRPLVGVGAVAAAAAAAWVYRDRLPTEVPASVTHGVEAIEDGLSVGVDGESDAVLLLVDTVPKGATVFVDDVIRTERPMRVPRSEQHLRVRVEAPGYEPRTIQVQPTTTRRVEVALERRSGRR